MITNRHTAREAVAQWRLSALEFSVAWQRIGYDRLPFPFAYLAAATSQEQFHIQRHSAAESVDALFDDDLEAALLTLAKPDVQVQVCGLSPTTSMVRIIAGITGDHGSVAIQIPTGDNSFGADILLSSHASLHVAGVVVQNLPRARPGAGPAFSIARRDLDTSASLRVTYSMAADRLRSSAVERLARPRSSVGDIIVGPPTMGGSRVTDPSNGFQWVDYDDGRYLVRGGDIISAIPATGPMLVEELRSRLG